MTDTTVTLAAAPYSVGKITTWDEFAGRIAAYAEEAEAAGAKLLVFPEYAPLDLARLFEAPVQADLGATFAALQDLLEPFRKLHAELARLHNLWIVAGSFPVREGADPLYLNRAFVYRPDGTEEFQDKILLTRFERAGGLMRGGAGLKVFAAEFGDFGVCICYDSEFPLLARAQAEAGAVLLAVPSCTDTGQGHHRVQTGCQARALENQIAVLHCPLLGDAPWSPAIDVNVGAPALYVPPDAGMPENGIVSRGQWNKARLLVVQAPLRRVQSLRRHGHVDNFADWKHQAGIAAARVP